MKNMLIGFFCFFNQIWKVVIPTFFLTELSNEKPWENPTDILFTVFLWPFKGYKDLVYVNLWVRILIFNPLKMVSYCTTKWYIQFLNMPACYYHRFVNHWAVLHLSLSRFRYFYLKEKRWNTSFRDLGNQVSYNQK